MASSSFPAYGIPIAPRSSFTLATRWEESSRWEESCRWEQSCRWEESPRWFLGDPLTINRVPGLALRSLRHCWTHLNDSSVPSSPCVWFSLATSLLSFSLFGYSVLFIHSTCLSIQRSQLYYTRFVSLVETFYPITSKRFMSQTFQTHSKFISKSQIQVSIWVSWYSIAIDFRT